MLKYMSRKRMLYRMIVIVLSVYVITGAMLFFRQSSYIYFPDNTDFYGCPYFEHIEKIEHNGTRMYYQNNGERLAVLYHGNAGSACDRSYFSTQFRSQGTSYLIVEYAGYSGDTERPSRERIYKDVSNVVRVVQNIAHNELILVGESIGAGVASYHATLQTPDKLLFISPFTSLSDVAKIHYPWYPVKWLLREEYDNVAALKAYKNKLLIIHGETDSIIPISLSQELLDKVPTVEKELIAIPNAGHNDLISSGLFFRSITNFITQ